MKNTNSKHLLYNGCHYFIYGVKYYVVGFGVVKNSKDEFWIIQRPDMELMKKYKEEMEIIIQNNINENKHVQ